MDVYFFIFLKLKRFRFLRPLFTFDFLSYELPIKFTGKTYFLAFKHAKLFKTFGHLEKIGNYCKNRQFVKENLLKYGRCQLIECWINWASEFNVWISHPRIDILKCKIVADQSPWPVLNLPKPTSLATAFVVLESGVWSRGWDRGLGQINISGMSH